MELSLNEFKKFVAPEGGENILDRHVGKYVLVRSRNEGINFGLVVAAEKGAILLAKARRLHYHIPLDSSQSWYEGVANSGLADNSRVSAEVDEKAIVEDYSITVCSQAAIKSIQGYKTYVSR